MNPVNTNPTFKSIPQSEEKHSDTVHKINILQDIINFYIPERSPSPRLRAEKTLAPAEPKNYLPEMSALMGLTPNQWQTRDNSFLLNKIDRYLTDHVPAGKIETYSWRHVRKQDLKADSIIVEIGDIHGDIDRLKATFDALRKKNYLNEAYQPIDKNIKFVFLGDYVDRGEQSLGVVEFVLTFFLENPDQVYLMGGNHEDPLTRAGKLERYAANDPRYLKFMKTRTLASKINNFFENLPVSVYIACKTDQAAKRRYMLYTHAAFNPYYDPIPLLEKNSSDHVEWIKKDSEFSFRVDDLTQNVDENTAKGLKFMYNTNLEIHQTLDQMDFDATDTYWLDVGAEFVSKKDDPYGRGQLSKSQIKAFFNLWNTDKVKISQMTRGHQADVRILNYDKYNTLPPVARSLVTTMDPTGHPDSQIFSTSKIAEDTYDWQRDLWVIPKKYSFNDPADDIWINDFKASNPAALYGSAHKRAKLIKPANS